MPIIQKVQVLNFPYFLNGLSLTWRARHFGIYQTLTSKMTALEKPDYFVDEMEKGIFHSFRHEHLFEEQKNGTLMIDKFEYRSPMDILGRIADWLFLKKYMTQLLDKRNQTIKECAESQKWRNLLGK